LKQEETKSAKTLAVIIPSRNGATYLRETLESLLKQTTQPDRIILSNNDSTDGTLTMFDSFSFNNSLVQVESTNRYLSLGASFNFAASHSTEDWILFLHSDDVLSPYAVQIIKREISKTPSDVGMISFEAEWINESSQLVRAKLGFRRTKFATGIPFVLNNLGGSDINFGAVVINRKIFNNLGGFDELNSLWLDLKFYHKLVIKFKIKIIPTPVLRYRVYTSIRNADQRQEIEKENIKYWNSTYLPELAKNLKFTLPEPNTPQTFLIKTKLFLKRERGAHILLRRWLISFRKHLDSRGIGMFGA
jgi:glycosyltransferase involved in cell wall biosynthesis